MRQNRYIQKLDDHMLQIMEVQGYETFMQDGAP